MPSSRQTQPVQAPIQVHHEPLSRRDALLLASSSAEEEGVSIGDQTVSATLGDEQRTILLSRSSFPSSTVTLFLNGEKLDWEREDRGLNLAQEKINNRTFRVFEWTREGVRPLLSFLFDADDSVEDDKDVSSLPFLYEGEGGGDAERLVDAGKVARRAMEIDHLLRSKFPICTPGEAPQVWSVLVASFERARLVFVNERGEEEVHNNFEDDESREVDIVFRHGEEAERRRGEDGRTVLLSLTLRRDEDRIERRVLGGETTFFPLPLRSMFGGGSPTCVVNVVFSEGETSGKEEVVSLADIRLLPDEEVLSHLSSLVSGNEDGEEEEGGVVSSPSSSNVSVATERAGLSRSRPVLLSL